MGAFRKAFLLLVAACWFGGSPAFADKRVALVIGNSAYETVPRLTNPASDAMLVADILRGAGFETVDLRSDLKIAAMRRVLRDFVEKTRDADVAVIYYAGHGIEVDGVNYLIPIDAVLERDVDIYDEAFSLDRVLATIEPAKQLRLVILDACRENPFARTMKRTVASRAIGRGLAKVEPAGPNTLVAFASKAGSTASDGDGKNSPFTAALVRHVVRPGLDLRKAFGYVRDDVLKATGNRQEPYVYGSLGGDDVPLVPAKQAASGPQADPQAAVRRDYELALQLATRDGWEAFLAQYGEGYYANLARGQLKKIAAEEARVVAAERARQAEQEKTRLAAESAAKAEQEKAAAAAKTAEEARLAAEKTKQIEQARAEAAEQARIAAERLAAQRAPSADSPVDDPASKAASQEVASLPPSLDTSRSGLSQAAIVKSVQSELRRVGCLISGADGEWNVASQRALSLFNQYARTKFDVNLASSDLLDAIKAKSARVCPLVCDRGFRANGDSCEKIREKRPIAKHDEAKPAQGPVERAKPEAAPPSSQASGQIYCNEQGCRPVRKGCRIGSKNEQNKFWAGAAQQIEVCN